MEPSGLDWAAFDPPIHNVVTLDASLDTDFNVKMCPAFECHALLGIEIDTYRYKKSDVMCCFQHIAETVNTLPLYVTERYIRLLTLWRNRQRPIRSLFQMCLRQIDPMVLREYNSLLPRRNYVIHRVFRRMLKAMAISALYYSIHEHGYLFENYNELSTDSLLHRWMSRNDDIQRYSCPGCRLKHRIYLIIRNHLVRKDTSHYPSAEALSDAPINFYVKPHQCGYYRHTCWNYVDIGHKVPKAKVLKIVSGRDEKKEPKVSAAKMQGDRAAQRAARKRH